MNQLGALSKHSGPTLQTCCLNLRLRVSGYCLPNDVIAYSARAVIFNSPVCLLSQMTELFVLRPDAIDSCLSFALLTLCSTSYSSWNQLDDCEHGLVTVMPALFKLFSKLN